MNKHLLSASIIFITINSTAVTAAALNLSFTTYTEYESYCGSGCIDTFYNNPEVGNYNIRVSLNELYTFANTDAFNGSTNYIESLDSSNNFYNEDTNASQSFSFTQTYRQSNGPLYPYPGSPNSEMSVSTSFNTSENKITDAEASYTGSLPEEFIPLLGAGQRRTDSYSDFSNNDYIGPDPRFLTPTTNVIEAYYLSQIGKDFNFYISSNSTTCTTEFGIYGWCEGREISSGNSYSNGYATLNSVEVVQTPIPTAAWLFGSALLGLAGIKRKK